MSSDLVIRVDHVSKAFPIYEKPIHRLAQMLSPAKHKQRWFRKFEALRDINFEVARGETVGVVGRNGSGKSTLLQVICGTLTPSLGQVTVHGRVAALLELGAGFNPEFTGRENVFLNGTVLGLTRKEIEQRFDEIAAFAEIGEFIDQPVKSYSSGMYVRLAFAVAIHVTPDVLVVDEALSVGDEAFQRKCYARINRIRENGAAILFVSHSAGTVTELCNRALLLDRGELLCTGTPKHVVARYHKMLYGPADRMDFIRNEIRRETVALENRNGMSPGVDDGEAAAVVGRSAGALPADNEDDGAYFDEGLVPKSTVRYETVGVHIEDVRIEALSGRRVNVLQLGGEYVYTYRVRFDAGADAVRYGMLIKNISGLELGGAVSSTLADAETFVKPGTCYEVRFRFHCRLVPGVYFLNAGVVGNVDGEEAYLDRYIDVAMFRVMHQEGRLATGMVDFGISPNVKKMNALEISA